MKRVVFIALIAVFGALMVPSPGRAASGVGNFEIDGNTVDSASGEPLDWDSPGLPNLVVIPDASGTTDNTFSSGSKENVPNEWTMASGSVPDKTDVTGGAIAIRELGSDTFAYINFTRAARTGDTFVNFELNRSTETYANSKGSVVPVRTAGDKLIGFFVTQGGQTLTVELRRWVGDRFSGSWVLMGSGTKGVDWDAAVNADANGRWDFAEAAINLHAFGLTPECPGIGRVWIKSTTSASFESASLADRTVQHGVNLSNCGTKNFAFSYSPMPISGTKVYATYTTSTPATKTVELVDPDLDGTYTARDDMIPAGSFSSSFQVRSDVDGDGNFTDVVWTGPVTNETFAPKQTITNTGSLVYQVGLTPASAENFAGRPHVLTGSVTETGTGTPLPNVRIDFVIASATPAGCGALSTLSAITDSAGNATTTLTASAGCSVAVDAWVNGAAGTSQLDQGEASRSATKTFVVYTMSVLPARAVNAPGTDHTFTVSLFRDTGSGPAGYAGQSVGLVLDPGASDAHLVSINGVAASGTNGTCTTNADGRCAIVITSTTPGVSTLTASYSTLNDSGEGTVTSSGEKTYEDYRVSVTPETADNEVGDEHAVLVTVERDQGNGFQPIAGVEVALSLNAGETDAHLVSINGDPAEGATGACTTRANGTCDVVFVSSRAGAVSLTASIGIQLDSGTLERDGTAAKVFSDFRLGVTPGSATNEVGDPHTFTIRLDRNDGNGFFGYAGQTVTFSLATGNTDAEIIAIDGEPASGVDGSCVTGSAGTCEVEIVSETPGAVSITGVWNGTFSGSSTATRTGSADKTYVKATLVNASCPTSTVIPGGSVDYSVAVTLEGGDLHNASVVERLPAGFKFVSASPAPDSAPAVGSSGDIVWDLGTLPAGTAPVFSVSGSIDPGVASGTTLTTLAEFSADEIITKASVHDLLVSNLGAVAQGRAAGLRAAGLLDIPATPDTDVTNPGEQAGLHELAPLVDAGLLQVAEFGGIENTSAADTAVARASSVSIEAGAVSVFAESIVGRSSSTASGNSAGSTAAGSTIKRLVVNGQEYLNIHEPMTIRIPGAAGDPIAEVRVLETTASGAAAGNPLSGGSNSSGLVLNALHVMVPATGLDVVVAHAESLATFPSGAACGDSARSVGGDASLLNLFGVGPELAAAQTGRVTLSSEGGNSNGSVADVTPVGLVAGSTHTDGSLDPLASSSSATITSLDLLGGMISATLIRAESATAGASTGSTTIAGLTIDGTDVCAAVGLDEICTPDPDTVLLLDGGNVIVVLNEQIGGDGLRVNAAHIFVVGNGNPLGLPAGAEFVIAGAYSNTSA